MHGVFQQILGTAFEDLPFALQQLHSGRKIARFVGRADVTRGRSVVANMIANLIGFPQAGDQQDVTVVITADAGQEQWVRSFASQQFSSRQKIGSGWFAGLLVESFGPSSFGIELVPVDGRLVYKVLRWSFLGIPMPMFLAPISETAEFVAEERFCFSVRISLPLIGLLVHYQGYLEPDP